MFQESNSNEHTITLCKCIVPHKHYSKLLLLVINSCAVYSTYKTLTLNVGIWPSNNVKINIYYLLKRLLTNVHLCILRYQFI